MRAGWVAVVVAVTAWSGVVGFRMLREIADFDHWWAERQAGMDDLAAPPDSYQSDLAGPESGEAC